MKIQFKIPFLVVIILGVIFKTGCASYQTEIFNLEKDNIVEKRRDMREKVLHYADVENATDEQVIVDFMYLYNPVSSENFKSNDSRSFGEIHLRLNTKSLSCDVVNGIVIPSKHVAFIQLNTNIDDMFSIINVTEKNTKHETQYSSKDEECWLKPIRNLVFSTTEKDRYSAFSQTGFIKLPSSPKKN